jgi:hypothetical protein
MHGEDADELEILLQSYAVCALLLYLLYFSSCIAALDPKAHLPEDSSLVAGDLEKLAKIEDGTDEAAKDQVWSLSMAML